MFTKITRIEPLDVVTLSEAKAQLNIEDFTQDDDLIRTYMAAASALVENGTNRLLSRCSVQLLVPASTSVIELPFGEAVSVTSVELQRTPVVTLTHEFSDFKQCVQVTDTSVSIESGEEMIITYECGYDETAIPAPLKSAALMIISNLYDHREDMIEANLSQVPLSSRILMDQYKINRWGV